MMLMMFDFLSKTLKNFVEQLCLVVCIVVESIVEMVGYVRYPC
jgi:hypothetical protein